MIKYNFTLDDFIAYRNYLNEKSSVPRKKKFIYGGMLILFSVINNYPDVLFKGDWHHSLKSLLNAVVMVLFIILYDKWSEEKWYPKRYYKRNPGAFGNKEIILADDTLIFERENVKTEIPYHKFLGLVDVEDYYYLITSKKSAIVVPKRCITEKTDEDTLKNKIQPYVN